MTEISVLGVTQLSDSYPNVKYKISLLMNLKDVKINNHLYPLKNRINTAFAARNFFLKLLYVFTIMWGHIKIYISYLFNQSPIVYITYPGIIISVLLFIIPKKFRPLIVLDAFISIYDTVVNDRKLLCENSFFAKIIHKIECLAYNTADRIIVDTEENRQFYSTLFDISLDKFVDIPLSIPNLVNTGSNFNRPNSFTCVFLGTLVPLQGIEVIAKAALELIEFDKIKIVVIGDGQDANFLEEIMKKNNLTNLIWHRGHYDTKFILKNIVDADLCLGIFGNSAKAQRVVPYKLYYYLSLGKPLVTAKTVCLERLCSKLSTPPFFMVSPGNHLELTEQIKFIFKHRNILDGSSSAPRDFFEENLSNAVISKKITTLFNELLTQI